MILSSKDVEEKYVPRQNFSLPTQQKLQAEQRVSVSGNSSFLQFPLQVPPWCNESQSEFEGFSFF
jgi:hypothetical protein